MLVLSKLKKYIINNINNAYRFPRMYINQNKVGYVNRQPEQFDICLYVGCLKYVVLIFGTLMILEICHQNGDWPSIYKTVKGRWVKY
jgi:hypothetical protein